MKKDKSDLLLFIITAELTGVLSSLFAGDSGGLYSIYEKPPLSPPGWLFPVVWTILYALMGISAYMVYSYDAKRAAKKRALAIYAVQLFVNFWWSIAFFGFDALVSAALIVVGLFILVAVMIGAFGRVSRTAALINIPYLLWVGFAAYLNIGTIVVNG